MNYLKKGILILLSVLLITAIGQAQTADKGFTGVWTLNKTKTNLKDLPREFKGYQMVINQTDNKISIKNLIEGAIEPHPDSGRTGGANTNSRPQDGIWGDSRGNTNTGATIKPNYSGSMALSKFLTPTEAAYILDGKEIEVGITNASGKVGSAKIKGKLENNGSSFKITTVRRMKTMKAQQTEMIIYVSERWEMLDDGKTIKYTKSVELPAATDDVLLYFTKS